MDEKVKYIINQLDFNLLYAQQLVKDVSEELMMHIPHKGLENHPAFTLGHLAVATAMTINYAGGQSSLPDLWNQLFKRNGPGDPRLPEENTALYPNKQALLKQLEVQHNHLKETLSQANIDDFYENTQWRLNDYLPSRLDCIIFMSINHEAMHLGQLAAWRRAMDLPSALARV